MMLQPGEYLQIVRDLQNPNITGTFYVRAVIKDAKTLAVLDTVDLIDAGNQLFRNEWRVHGTRNPGYFIITTKVYTDAGYTTLSQDYGNFTETYQVREFKFDNPNNFPSADLDIDYKKIRKILGEEIDKRMKKEKADDMKDPHMEMMDRMMNEILDNVKLSSKLPIAIKDLSGELSAAETRLAAKIKEPEKTDFMPLVEEIRALNEPMNTIIGNQDKHTKYFAAIHAVADRIFGVVQGMEQTVSHIGSQLRSIFDNMQAFIKVSNESKNLFDQIKRFTTAWKTTADKMGEVSNAVAGPTEPTPPAAAPIEANAEQKA